MVRAQTILRKTFGMELVELQARLEADDPNQKAKDAMNIKKKGTDTSNLTPKPKQMLLY